MSVETFAGVELHRRNVRVGPGIHVDAVLTRAAEDRCAYTTNITSNGSTWGGEPPLPLAALAKRLGTDPLDRCRFDRFAYQLRGDAETGTWRFFGNFLTYSHGFVITSNDPAVIEALRASIRSNQHRADYREQPPYVTPRRRASELRARFGT